MLLEWKPCHVVGSPRTDETLFTSVTEDERSVLRGLALDKVMLEVGTGYGHTAISMAVVARLVVTVDPCLTYATGANIMFNAHRHEVASRLSVAVTKFQDFPDTETPWADLVFIDGDHRYHHVAHDVDKALPMIVAGGYLACHDYNEDTCDVRRALDDRFPEGPDYLVDTLWVKRIGLAP